MCDWLDEYRGLDSPHEKYDSLRAEMARLRGEAHESDDGELFDRDEIAAALRSLDDALDGDLIAFVANDFGLPVAFRPDSVPAVHKVIVADYGEEIRYHLPEGSNGATNFLTVWEMVGLVDYTTNSAQRDGLSQTY